MSGTRIALPRRLAFAVLTVVLGLGLVELVAAAVERWVLPSTIMASPEPGPIPNEALGEPSAEETRRWAANMAMIEDEARGWGLPIDQLQREGELPFRTNSLGMRGAEPSPRLPGEVRLLTLGDSSIFGYGVPEGAVFSERAAAELSQRWDRPVTAWNGAVPGHDSSQALSGLKRLGPTISPDFVVVGCIWSDIYAQDHHSAAAAPSVAMGRRLATWRTARRVLAPWLRSAQVRWIASAEDIGAAQDAGPQGTRVSLRDYSDNLRAMVAESQALGARTVFVALPAPMDLDAAPPPETVALFRTAMAHVAAATQSPLVDGPSLLRENDDPTALFLDQVHPSNEGHARLGTALADIIDQVGAPAASPRP